MKECVSKGNSDDPGKCEDKEGKELALFATQVSKCWSAAIASHLPARRRSSLNSY
jgi:hypothetical protein